MKGAMNIPFLMSGRMEILVKTIYTRRWKDKFDKVLCCIKKIYCGNTKKSVE